MQVRMIPGYFLAVLLRQCFLSCHRSFLQMHKFIRNKTKIILKRIQSKSSCVSIASSAELYESGGQAVTSCTASGLGISAHVHWILKCWSLRCFIFLFHLSLLFVQQLFPYNIKIHQDDFSAFWNSATSWIKRNSLFLQKITEMSLLVSRRNSIELRRLLACRTWL